MSRTKLNVDALILQTYYVQPEIYELDKVKDEFSEVTLSAYDRERTICDCFNIVQGLIMRHLIKR